MVKISDIIKDRENDLPDKKPHKITPREEKTERKQEKEEIAPDLSSSRVSEELYYKMITHLKETIDKINHATSIKGDEIKQIIEEMVGQILSGDETLLKLATQPVEHSYPYSHMVNVSIITVKLAAGLNFNKVKLIDLGLSALFHDEKYAKKVEVITKFKQERKKDVAERFNEIIKVVDIYESLTHPRSYRQEISSYEVMKAIIESSKHFLDYEVVKLLLEKISLYPLGSKVLLSTNEVGKVIGISKNMPLRPKVEVELDIEGIKLKTPKFIDLINQPHIYIKKIVIEEKTNNKS